MVLRRKDAALVFGNLVRVKFIVDREETWCIGTVISGENGAYKVIYQGSNDIWDFNPTTIDDEWELLS